MKKLFILFITLVLSASILIGCSSASTTATPTWTSQKDPASSQSTLHSVWGASSADVFAVGDGGTIIHYNGKSWSKMNSGTTNDLAGVWGTSADDIFAVGAHGTMLYYNGNSWRSVADNNTNDLVGVWGGFLN